MLYTKYDILYYTILYYTILYYTILYYTTVAGGRGDHLPRRPAQDGLERRLFEILNIDTKY